jgi:DNA repair protein RadC
MQWGAFFVEKPELDMEPYKRMRIKDLAEEDRPREKLLAKGIGSLSDAELIAILIGSGNADETAVEVGQKMLALAGNNLNELGKKTVDDLTQMKGIGPAKAVSVVAALELGRRRKLADMLGKKQVNGSRDAFLYMSPQLSDLPHEEFWVMLLSQSNKVLDRKRISQGGVSGTVADVRLIMKHAIDKLASGLILCHNHPSGNTQPSEHDKALTKKIKEAGLLVNVQVLDHIIIGDDHYYSFADNALI